jgi:hypothetical protein
MNSAIELIANVQSVRLALISPPLARRSGLRSADACLMALCS